MACDHAALIVEDEPEMAAALCDLVDSLGHDPRHATTRADAIEILNEGGLCYVLLDLQIPAHEKSLQPRVEVGKSLLLDIRRRYPGRVASAAHDIHLLPVLVVSGQAKDHDDVVQALQEGGDDFVRKPLSLDDRGLGAKIGQCLNRSGRSDHGACDGATVVATGAADRGGAEPPFTHTADYSEVTLNGETYLFTGFVQREVIRFLHEAVNNDRPWQPGKGVLYEAGSTNAKMINLFRDHPCWGTLIESNRHGLYRLRTE